jgi:hypothetical protein
MTRIIPALLFLAFVLFWSFGLHRRFSIGREAGAPDVNESIESKWRMSLESAYAAGKRRPG